MHVLFVGAHPDDCDFSAGGTAALLARAGHSVRFLSVTSGDRGHMDPTYARDRSLLGARRLEEARRAAAVFGGDFHCLHVPDGDVYVTPELTAAMVRALRSWGPPGHGPDLVLTNRPNDYHRDHRYTAQLVLDSAYLLTVPLMCPDTPHLARMPVFAYWYDAFREGGAFRPDVVVPIDGVLEAKTDIAVEHASQLFEWLPYNAGTAAEVPPDAAGRRAFTRARLEARAARVAEACRVLAPHLVPAGCRCAEAFQLSEYGRRPGEDELSTLFPVTG